MNRFEWTSPRSVEDAIGAAATTVADAMVSGSGQPPSDGTVFKAGGIDLLDLMKEGLLAPRRVINLRTVPGLDRIEEGDGGALRIGTNVTLAANPASCDHRGQPAATAALLVFPVASPSLRPQGRQFLLRVRWREPAPRHLRSQWLRDRSSLHGSDCPGGARRIGGPDRCESGAAHRAA